VPARTVSNEPGATPAEVNPRLGGADEVGLEEEAAVGILSAHMTEEPLIVRGGLENERLRVSLRARTRARARKPAP